MLLTQTIEESPQRRAEEALQQAEKRSEAFLAALEKQREKRKSLQRVVHGRN